MGVRKNSKAYQRLLALRRHLAQTYGTDNLSNWERSGNYHALNSTKRYNYLAACERHHIDFGPDGVEAACRKEFGDEWTDKRIAGAKQKFDSEITNYDRWLVVCAHGERHRLELKEQTRKAKEAKARAEERKKRRDAGEEWPYSWGEPPYDPS